MPYHAMLHHGVEESRLGIADWVSNEHMLW